MQVLDEQFMIAIRYSSYRQNAYGLSVGRRLTSVTVAKVFLQDKEFNMKKTLKSSLWKCKLVCLVIRVLIFLIGGYPTSRNINNAELYVDC